ncbi:unnamed protein product [Calicophoron daubneyi]|uniref:Zinc transporter ZIP3 n=1 Tax=Calicophoron daubneyi TaxID=300641 RepID=A0AAV2TKP3_CALDB
MIGQNWTEQEELTSAKLGLASVTFVYATLACAVPIVLVGYIHTHRKRPELDFSTHSDDAHQTKTVCYRCFHWNHQTREKFMSRANCLAAGALMSVGLMEVYMEASESVEKLLTTMNLKTKFPIVSFITLLGFFLILGVEQINMALYMKPTESVNHRLEPLGKPQSQEENHTDLVNENHTSQYFEPLGNLEHSVPSSDGGIDLTAVQTTHTHGGSHHTTISAPDRRNWIRVIILLCAMSLHSIFEGIALGLCPSLTSLLTLFTAISVHKSIIAVSIGISLAIETEHKMRQSATRSSQTAIRLRVFQALAILAFAGASPLGTLIGWAVSSQPESEGFLIVKAALQGLACGTLVYVVFYELLPHEFQEKQSDRPGKFLFLIFGFSVVSAVIAFAPEKD